MSNEEADPRTSNPTFGQQESTWKGWSWLIGEWTGEGSGEPGQGSGSFSLLPDLDGKILIRKNHSEYPATAEKPKIVHDDLMIIYLDQAGQPTKAIYFDNEGHLINYEAAFSENTIVLTSSKLQEQPVFRLTYIPIDGQTVNIRFEISPDGRTFHLYTEGKCFRN